jgi:peroxin-6
MYQPLILQGLKNFFDGKKRLVKQGDLLAVKVDLNQLQYLQASSSGDGVGADTGAVGVGERLVLCLNPQVHVSRTTRESTYPSTAEKDIYFTVTNIECDPPSMNRALNPSDVHFGLSAGELGCWVDSAVTRLTQTGLEHARIPDVSGFLSAWFSAPPGVTILTVS